MPITHAYKNRSALAAAGARGDHHQGTAMIFADTEEFLRYYDAARQRTRRVIACIPEEHIEWRYADGKFSFGDLVRHLAAIERFM